MISSTCAPKAPQKMHMSTRDRSWKMLEASLANRDWRNGSMLVFLKYKDASQPNSAYMPAFQSPKRNWELLQQPIIFHHIYLRLIGCRHGPCPSPGPGQSKTCIRRWLMRLQYQEHKLSIIRSTGKVKTKEYVIIDQHLMPPQTSRKLKLFCYKMHEKYKYIIILVHLKKRGEKKAFLQK